MILHYRSEEELWGGTAG